MRRIAKIFTKAKDVMDDLRLFFAMWQDNRNGHNIDEIERFEKSSQYSGISNQ